MAEKTYSRKPRKDVQALAKMADDHAKARDGALGFVMNVFSVAPFVCGDPTCGACEIKREQVADLVMKRDNEKIEAGRAVGMTQGIAYAAAHLIRYHGSEVEAREILSAAGIKSIQELIDNKVDEFDLEPLREVLK